MNITLTEAIESFTTALQANNRSPHTISCYRRDLRGLLAFTGDIPVSALTPDVLYRFVLSEPVRQTAGGSRKADLSVGRTKAALRSFGRHLVDMGWLTMNPAGRLEIRRSTHRTPEYLNDTERHCVQQTINSRSSDPAGRDCTMMAVFLGTGLRLSELVGLNVSDIDLDGRQMIVRVKGGRTETRRLNSSLCNTLSQYLQWRMTTHAETDALFLSSRAQRISARQVQTRCAQWYRQAGIDRPGLSVHSLRHTFGTRLYGQTHDLVLVGKALEAALERL